MVYNFNTNLVNIPENCTCALISSKNGNFEPILLGAMTVAMDKVFHEMKFMEKEISKEEKV